MTGKARLLIDAKAILGESIIWHPDRQALFWFDIARQTLHGADADGKTLGQWSFPQVTTAAGLVDRDRLVLVSETGTSLFEIETGRTFPLQTLEAQEPDTRSNDCRVDPAGGFWISTMGKAGDDAPGAGSLYRVHAGHVSTLLTGITIGNAVCFSPKGERAYFTDTPTRRILTCPIEAGLPSGPWTLFADVADQRGFPDGAVVDSEGYLWSARYGGWCVVRHAPDGHVDQIIELPVANVTCPAFGGPDLKTLYLTTACEGLTDDDLARQEGAGGLFAVELDVAGQAEHRVAL